MIVTGTVALGDQAMSLVAERGRGWEWLDAFFGDRRLVRSEADLTVTVRTVAALPSLPEVAGVRNGPTQRWADADSLAVGHDLQAMARVNERVLEIDVSDTSDDPARAVRHLLLNTLSWWLDRRGQTLLHGAMIARNGDAALILGGTGRGKSSAALAAWNADWDLCADDLVIADTADGVPRGWGIPKRPAVDAELARRLGGPADSIRHDARRRVELRSSGLSTGWRDVRLLVVVEHHDGDGLWRRLDHESALAAVGSSFFECDSSESVRRQWRTIAALAGVPAVELLHAADGGVRSDRAVRFLEEAWSDIAARTHGDGQ